MKTRPGTYLEDPIEIGGSNASAFGDLITANLTPVVQLDFVYGLNTQLGVETELNSATVDTDSGRLRLQSGTNSAGSAIFRSKLPIEYRQGEGTVARFTTVFTTSSANSTQLIGAGSSDDGFFFGYNGTSFGICHRIRTVDTWTAQSSWNGDKMDGTGNSGQTYNPAYGSPCMIMYPYLGYGNVKFYIQSKTTTAWILVHTIRYANTTTATQLGNPSLYFYAQVLNAGNTTNLTMYVGSVGMFISGIKSLETSPDWAMDSNKSGVTTETNIITFQNATTYNTVTNRSVMQIIGLSFGASAASGIAVIRMKVNATLGGVPAYTTINGTTGDNGVTITSGNSAVSYDTAGTTVTGGNYIRSFTIDNPGSMHIDFSAHPIQVQAGETLTISGYSSATSAISVAVNFIEDI